MPSSLRRSIEALPSAGVALPPNFDVIEVIDQSAAVGWQTDRETPHGRGRAILLATDFTMARHVIEQLLGTKENEEDLPILLCPPECLAGPLPDWISGRARVFAYCPGGIGPEDIEALRAAGLKDGRILEINQVTAYFAYANRTVTGLGVDTAGEVLGFSPDDSQDWHHG